jgi:hypothetical protein
MDSIVRFHIGFPGVIKKQLVVFLVRFKQSLVMKDNSDIEIGVLQEVEGGGPMNSTLTFTTWNYPYLSRTYTAIDSSKHRGSELVVVEVHLYLLEDILDCCMLLHEVIIMLLEFLMAVVELLRGINQVWCIVCEISSFLLLKKRQPFVHRFRAQQGLNRLV